MPIDSGDHLDFTIWDRLNLTDEEMGSPKPPKQPEENWRNCLRRDLEDLLNARRPPVGALQEFPPTSESVFNFGLPDLTTLNLENPNDRNQACKAIESVLRCFEPRLSGVTVSTESGRQGGSSSADTSMLVGQFYVSALVLVHGEKRRFRFRTEFQRDRRWFIVNQTE